MCFIATLLHFYNKIMIYFVYEYFLIIIIISCYYVELALL